MKEQHCFRTTIVAIIVTILTSACAPYEETGAGLAQANKEQQALLDKINSGQMTDQQKLTTVATTVVNNSAKLDMVLAKLGGTSGESLTDIDCQKMAPWAVGTFTCRANITQAGTLTIGAAGPNAPLGTRCVANLTNWSNKITPIGNLPITGVTTTGVLKTFTLTTASGDINCY